MSPYYTILNKNARDCESCHASQKALGLGIGSTRPWNERHFVDLETVDGKILPRQVRPQMEPIESLDHDWSRIVDEKGRQLATVGHHFKLSRAFNAAELGRVGREGTCLACHQEIPDKSLAVGLLHHIAEFSDRLPKTPEQHGGLVHKVLLTAAWVQALGLVFVMASCGAVVAWWLRHRRARG